MFRHVQSFIYESISITYIILCSFNVFSLATQLVNCIQTLDPHKEKSDLFVMVDMMNHYQIPSQYHFISYQVPMHKTHYLDSYKGVQKLHLEELVSSCFVCIIHVNELTSSEACSFSNEVIPTPSIGALKTSAKLSLQEERNPAVRVRLVETDASPYTHPIRRELPRTPAKLLKSKPRASHRMQKVSEVNVSGSVALRGVVEKIMKDFEVSFFEFDGLLLDSVFAGGLRGAHRMWWCLLLLRFLEWY